MASFSTMRRKSLKHKTSVKMHPAPPEYLWRAWGVKTHGHNSPNLFKSALATSTDLQNLDGMIFNGAKGLLKDQIKTALYAKDAIDNPTVFFTSSPLYAIQHAIRKEKTKEEKQTKIICIKTATTRTQDGKPIQWRHIPVLKEQLKMVKLSAQFTYDELDYTDVWVTTDSIVPGDGSFCASFEMLVAGDLFGLFPDMQVNSWLGKPGLAKPVTDFRERHFAIEVDLPHNEISLAAKLAACFMPIRGIAKPSVPSHLISSILALKNQSPTGRSLRGWLERSCASYPWTIGNVDAVMKSCIHELDQSRRLDKVLSRRGISRIFVNNLHPVIPYTQILRVQRLYKQWRKAKNAKLKRDREKENQRSTTLTRRREGYEDPADHPQIKMAKIDISLGGCELLISSLIQ